MVSRHEPGAGKLESRRIANYVVEDPDKDSASSEGSSPAVQEILVVLVMCSAARVLKQSLVDLLFR